MVLQVWDVLPMTILDFSQKLLKRSRTLFLSSWGVHDLHAYVEIWLDLMRQKARGFPMAFFRALDIGDYILNRDFCLVVILLIELSKWAVGEVYWTLLPPKKQSCILILIP